MSFCLFICFLQYRKADNYSNLHVLVFFLLNKFLQCTSPLLYFTISSKEKPGHTFNTLLKILNQTSKFIHFNFCFPLKHQLMKHETQINQVLCHFVTKITFPPVSNNMFFISVWDLTRIAVIIYIPNYSFFKAIMLFLVYTSKLF